MDKLYWHTYSSITGWEHERRTPPPYIIGMMERILELEKELSEKG